MSTLQNCLVSVVVPVYNEGQGLRYFHDSLVAVMDSAAKDAYEIVYCNDGSTDRTLSVLKDIAKSTRAVRVITLSRNFGKETATTAGIHEARGQAIIMLDADGQHPVELIPKFIERWRAGSKVVVGIRTDNMHEGAVKRYGSKLFYWIFNRFTGMKLTTGLSDFQLIDRVVQQEFRRLSEHNRITRGLIDWLGFPREYIHFKAKARIVGEAGYSFKKLLKLAVDSVISLSISPLYITAYIGAIILPISVLLVLFMLGNFVLGDPAGLRATGGAYLMVLMLFLISVLLLSQGIIGLYLSHIHTETQDRPLYVVDEEKSVRLA
ncbi:MAG TPA: glycosyltransferase family 2 protein [Patescibacteria group bacterium]|nr:glycosyltransferase family 2 protein [Patescibacteria group bacterium]